MNTKEAKDLVGVLSQLCLSRIETVNTMNAVMSGIWRSCVQRGNCGEKKTTHSSLRRAWL